MTVRPARQEPRLRSDPTVVEGGTIVVEVGAGVSEVTFKPEGHAPVKVRVHDGRAEFPLPSTVRAGSSVVVSDLKYPRPASLDVTVIGGNRP